MEIIRITSTLEDINWWLLFKFIGLIVDDFGGSDIISKLWYEHIFGYYRRWIVDEGEKKLLKISKENIRDAKISHVENHKVFNRIASFLHQFIGSETYLYLIDCILIAWQTNLNSQYKAEVNNPKWSEWKHSLFINF